MDRIVWVALIAALPACGGRIRLDEATVDARLDRIDTSVPLCASTDGTTARRAASAVADLWALARRASRVAPLAPNGALRREGSCGGLIDVTSAHESGVTDFVVTMSAFCLNSDEGPILLDGVVNAKQIGKPSDAGPVISALEVATDGPVALTSGDQTIELVLDGARADYGLPAAWTPEVPDADHPDVVTVREATATFPDDDGREDFVKGLRFERVGAVPAALTITDGTAGTSGEGYVDVRTVEGDPLLLDIGQVGVTGGTLELRGSGGSVVTVTPGTPGTFALTLDGAPYDRGVDCSAARTPLVEGGLALLSVLPIQ